MTIRRGSVLACLLAAGVALAGCKGVQTMLDPAGEQAQSIDVIWRAMLWVCGAMYLLVVLFLAWAIWRARRAPDLAERAIEPATGHTLNEPVLERTLGGWTALIVVGLTGLILLSFFVDRSLAGHNRPPLDVTVTANQWWWSVRYEDGTQDQYLTTANELHLPVDRPARLKLVANDVIHSFWAPNLSGKQDLIPGRTNYLTVTPRRVGQFRAQCAEFCGLQHAHMALTLTVEKPEDFNRWRSQQLQTAPPPSTPEQMAGQQLFQSRACVLCHAISGTPAGGVTAPDLTHIASRPTLAAGTLPNNSQNLKAWIEDPARFKPGVNMPKVPLSDRELNQLVAYLGALK